MKISILKSLLLPASLLLLTSCGSNTKVDGGDLPVSEQGLSATIACTVADETTSPIRASCYVLTVDGNAQPVSGLTYTISLINDRIISGSTGTILSETPIRFTDYNKNFSREGVRVSDNLIIGPTVSANDPSYLGGWKIVGVNNSDLTFSGDNIAYNLETTEGLSYVIGSARGISVQEHKEDDNTDNTGKKPEGFYYFDLVYTHDLKGSTVYIGAHTTGNRVGGAVLMKLELPTDDNSSDPTEPTDPTDPTNPDTNTTCPDGETGDTCPLAQ